MEAFLCPHCPTSAHRALRTKAVGAVDHYHDPDLATIDLETREMQPALEVRLRLDSYLLQKEIGTEQETRP